MKRHYGIAAAALILTACSAPAPKTEKPAEPPKSVVKITQFYASPARVARGEAAQLCYGVDGASEVKLTPPVDKVWPSQSRCLEVKPAATTTYVLAAEDASGNSVTEKTTITVGPPKPAARESKSESARLISEVTVSKLEAARGEQITVCYTAHGATSVTITPGQAAQQSTERGCITDRPTQTTTYQVVAKGAGGQTDSEHVTVRVR